MPRSSGRDGSELDKFIVVRGVGARHVGEIDDRRAERCELRHIGACANPGNAARDRSGGKERSIVLGEYDVERLLRLAEAPQLRFEHIDVDVGRGEQDDPNLVGGGAGRPKS
jgi:hypothetical protein